MDFNDFQYEARRTQRKDLPLWATREHALFGIASEAGEILGLFQKVHQGHPLDETALRLECGDLIWMIAELCDCYGWSMEDVAKANIQKLRTRYPHEFSVEDCEKRVDTLNKGRVYKVKRKPVRSRYYSSVKGAKG